MQQFLYRVILRFLYIHNDVSQWTTLDCVLISTQRRENLSTMNNKNSCNNFCNYVEWWFFTRTYNVRTYSSNCACYLERRMMMLDSQCYLNAREKKICQSKNSCNNFSLALIVTIFLNRIYSQWCSNDPQSCTYSNIFTIIFKRFSIAHLFDRKRRENLSMSNNFFDYVD